MIPILFDSSATTFTSNGLGRLDAIECVTREEIDGIYELDLTYPVSGPRFSDLVVSNIILAQPYDGATPQPFRIYKVGKEISGRVTVNARHISYQLNWIPVMPFNYSSLSDCFTKLKSYSVYTNPFTFWTDKTVTTGGAFTEPLPCRSMLGGVQGSVLQRYGGDYEWDGWTVKLWKRRGSDNGVRISYGKNLIDAAQETNIENTYTGVCPFWKNDDGGLVTLPEKYILASTASGFPFLRIQMVDFSSDFESQPTVAQLRTRTQQYITANNIGHPSISIDVNFIALWQTEEYKDLAPLERVQLGDTVTVYFEKLGINEQARVEAYEYDVLRERYNEITIGDAKSSFAKTFVDQGRILEESIDNSYKRATQFASDIVQKNTDWLTNGQGYVVAVKNTDGSWKELLFMDTPSTATARKVLRINENGIGFSDSGVGGPYAQAWTLDGTLSLGGVNNAYGHLVLLSNEAKKTIDLDKSGLTLYAADGKKIVELDGGGFALYNANGKMIAEFSKDGCWFDEYNSGGSRTASAYVYGDGIMVSAAGSNDSTDLTSGQVMVTTDSKSTLITGDEVSTDNVIYKTLNGNTCYNGTFTFDDGTVFTIIKGAITSIEPGSGGGDWEEAVNSLREEVAAAVEDLQQQIDDIGGGGGVTDLIEIAPDRWVDLDVTNGRIVGVNQGPW